MMVPIFTLNLNKKILPHRIAMGKYDGLHPCLTAVTANDKIFIHNPHTQVKKKGDRWINNTNEASDISLLNVQQSVSCIACGTLKPDSDQDILFVGMSTSLLAYDVENNSDVFFKDIQDGVNCLAIGKVGHSLNNLVLAGGNSSLQSFDQEGNDKLWTVIGDNVSSMALVDFNQDNLNEVRRKRWQADTPLTKTGQICHLLAKTSLTLIKTSSPVIGIHQLIVGSEDFDIRAFKDDQMIMEVKETEAVTGLCSMMEDNFGYALANGTVGVYKKQERVWRIKSKNQAVSIFSFDLDGDGYPELLTGWSNGKVDARNISTGEVVFKDNFGSCIAGLTKGDYNMDGEDQLIITAVDGEVRGYAPSTLESRQQIIDATFEQETIRELSLKKQHLLLELHNYEENSRVAEESNGQLMGRPTQEMDNHGVIPANTQLKTGLTISMGSDKVLPHVEIAIETTNDTIVRAVLIFAEGIFEGECLVVHEKESKVASNMRIPLFPPKDVPVDLHIKAFIGYKGSDHFHVFELTRQLPRFAMYALTSGKKPDEPNSSASFATTAPTYRVVEWLNNNFLLLEDIEDKGFINVKFVSLRTAEAIVILLDENGSVTVKADNMELAGDIIQSMAEFLSIEELVVSADYPRDIEKLKKLLVKVDELQSIRQRLFADMADNSGAIRSLILHAEDARLMEDYKAMRHWYQELNSLNRDLLNSYRIRAQNQEELLGNLKKVNQIIQRAGRLRVGKAKTLVISGCRNAIKENNIEKLIKIISVGEI